LRPSGASPPRVFLLSPAHCGGKRAGLLARPEAAFDLAVRLRTGGAPLGEVFSFLSGLYFRGKAAYAEAFAAPPQGVPGALVITSGRGLLPPDVPVTPADLTLFRSVPVDPREKRYTEPLEADVRALVAHLPLDAELVLLGSISSRKYVDLLEDLTGGRLCFPQAFVGMGDMQRGSLLLRAAGTGTELPYVRAGGAVRRRADGRVGSRSEGCKDARRPTGSPTQ
jgi:hypothetical protein